MKTSTPETVETLELTPAVPCPNCGTASRVREILSQSSLREGIGGEASRSLGMFAYCGKCACSFKLEV